MRFSRMQLASRRATASRSVARRYVVLYTRAKILGLAIIAVPPTFYAFGESLQTSLLPLMGLVLANLLSLGVFLLWASVKPSETRRIIAFDLFATLVFITVGVYLSGKLHSLMAISYLLLPPLAALIIPRRYTGLLSAGVCCVIYFGLVMGLSAGIMPLASDWAAADLEITVNNLPLIIVALLGLGWALSTVVETRQRTDELAALYAVARELASRRDLSSLLKTVVEHATAIIGASGGSIFLYDKTCGDLELRFAKGLMTTGGARMKLGEGIAGHVAQTLQPLIVNDRQTWERHRPVGESFCATLQTPMLYGDELIGVLAVSEPQFATRRFTEDEAQLLAVLAGQAASAIHDVRLYETTVRQLNELTLLYDATLASIGVTPPDLKTALKPTLEAIVRCTAADYAGIYLTDGGGVYAQAGDLPSRDEEWELLLAGGKGISGWVFKNGQPQNVPDVSRDERYVEACARAQTRSVLCVPIKIGDRVCGVLNLESATPAAFSNDDTRLVTTVAALLASLSENARLYQALEARIADLNRTQAQLERSARLAGVGQMAASLAHEINNPMASILGFSELAYQQSQGDTRADLEIVLKEARRVRDIVRSLLDFSRKRDLRKEMADVNGIVGDTLRLIRYQTARARVRTNEVYSAELPLVSLDVNQMKQVLLNLITNAVQAMPNGGDLTISTAFMPTPPEVIVSVRDTGIGILPENIPHLFEPFFTTKEASEGTGLGLVVSYGIVQNHGGRIDVESEVGKGSTFSVCLPVTDNHARDG